ncbi:hypothetical protein EC968_007471 [Mortierella alpina]|nr:hypothetical protein EC968_007471 [Mortierella alpina]
MNMKALHVLRRRHLILLVPVVNFVFLFLYVVSPRSLPRLPRFLSRSRGLTDDLPYLWDLRRQVAGVRLTPLPDHLITTYRPKYLGHPKETDDFLESAQEEAIDRDNSTKYLTFLPHSGFHNQRTELENALLLARLLNRTLIMPKVYLGPPMPWLEFRFLHSRLLYQTKIGLDHCRAIIEYKELDVVNLAQVPPPPPPPPSPPPSPSPSPSPSSDQSQQQQQLQPQQQQQPQQLQQDLQQPVMHHHHQVATPFTPVASEALDQRVADSDSRDGEALSVDAGQDFIRESYDDDDRDLMEAEEEFEEDDVPSWIEEPDGDETDKIRIATGDKILDLDEDDDGSDRDPNDWDAMEDGEEAGYEDEEDLLGNRVGIIETEGDDDDLEPDWRPEVFTLPDYLQQQYQNRRSRHRQRLMAQKMRVPGAVPSLPLDRPWRSSDRRGRSSSMWKRSLPQSEMGQGATDPGSSRQQLLKRQLAPPPTQQPPQQPETKPRFKWNPLPAECLQYESWTMTDWDLFFDLNPLRRYVRVFTRESISMEYLSTQFGLEIPKEEDPPSNSTDLSSNSTELGFPPNSTDPASPTTPLDIVSLPISSESSPADALGPDLRKDIGSKGSESESESGDDDQDKDDEDDKKEEEDNSAPDDDADTDDDERKRPLLRSEGDVLFFDDANLYDYRFTEDPKSAESKRTRSKYLEEFTVDWLAQRPERLIHLGSIFGSGRVIIETLQSKAWLQMIRDHLIIRTDILQTTSQRIVDKIRGHRDEDENKPLMQDPLDAGFVGVHIRMSDGQFSLSARDTIENIRQELMWQMGITDGQPREDASDFGPSSHDMGSRPKRHGRLSIEECRTRAINHRQVLREQLARLEQQRQQYLEQQRLQQEQQQQQQQQEEQQGQLYEPYNKDQFGSSSPPLQPIEQHTFPRPVAEAPGRRSNGRYTPIYLATDAHHPRSNPIFDRLFETFECVFTLDDFAEDLEELRRFRNPEDGTLMTKFLIPMVDAMVVAKAGAFFGTPASTFSTYIQKQLRPAYTGLYD